MIRVKIMLTAISVLAVFGGALAFKAKRFQQICYYSTTTTLGAGTTCPLRGQGTTVGAVDIVNGTFNTTRDAEAGICTTSFVPKASCTVKHAVRPSDDV